MHIMFIPSWYSNVRNKVHGSFFKEQASELQKAGVKVTVAYNEVWPLTMLGKIHEKKGLKYNVEDGLKTYRYKNYNYIPKNALMFKVFNKRMEKLYKEIVKKEGPIDIIHAQSSLWGGISAAYIAEKYNILTANTGVFPQTSSEPENPYFSMFCDIDMEKYNEVLLWRRYNTGLGVANEVCQYGCVGNNGVGTTKSMIDAFILKNGEPIYYNKKTKTYISQDIGSADGSGPHNGGGWKMGKSPQELNSKSTRLGTYDGNLNRIGD